MTQAARSTNPEKPAAGGVPPPWVIFGVTITGILSNTLVNAPLPDILDAFDRPDSDAGFFVAAAALPGIVTAVIIGVLADRHGRRAVLVPCLTLFGIAGTASAFAPNYESLLALRFAQGIGAAGLINLAVVLIGDHWHGAQRARYLGYNSAVLTTSIAISPAIGGGLADLGGWRASFAPYSLALVTAAVVARRLPSHAPGVNGSLREQLSGSTAVLRTPVVLGAIAWGFAVFVLIFGLFLTVLPLHLEQQFGLSAGARGLVLAVPAIGSSTAALQLGRLRRRHGARRLVIAGAGLFAVGFTTIGFAASLPFLALGALIYGVGEGSSVPTVQDLVSAAAPQASRGVVIAVFVSAIRTGQTVGPLLAGALLARFDTATVFLIGAAAAGLLMVALALVRVPRRA